MLNHKDKLAVPFQELIAAAGEVAFEYAQTDNDGRRLARIALIEFLKNGSNAVNLDSDFSTTTSGHELLH